MSEQPPRTPVRQSSVVKRQAVLAAARDLFAREGVDRVSMDAVAARAGVSKATIYGYFVDKRGLFEAILAEASSSLEVVARGLLDEHLSNEAGIATIDALERALTHVAIDIGTLMVGSAEYSAVFALVGQQRRTPENLDDDISTEAMEVALAERIAHFVQLGLLETQNPRLAADHFTALTVLLAYTQQPYPSTVNTERVRQTMIDGVQLFVRGYRAN